MPISQNKIVGPDANSELAYKYWLARCFRDGSPEEDMFRAFCANSAVSLNHPKPHSHRPRVQAPTKRLTP